MAKATTKLAKPVVTVNSIGGVIVALPVAIRNNCEVLRWLNHWAIDAMADRGHVKWMVAHAEERLEGLGTDIVSNSVADLVRQALEATSKPKESQRPKRAAKGKRK